MTDFDLRPTERRYGFLNCLRGSPTGGLSSAFQTLHFAGLMDDLVNLILMRVFLHNSIRRSADAFRGIQNG